MTSLQNTLKLEQSQKLTPALYQSMKILSLSGVDLELEIERQLETNPALDIDDNPPLETSSSSYYNENEEFEVADTFGETLQQHLLAGLGLLNLTAHTQNLAQLVIQNLDHKGFHWLDPSTLHPALTSPKTLASVLKIVQKLDPEGCATFNTFDSLSVQLHFLGYSLYPADTLQKALQCYYKGKLSSFCSLLHINEENEPENIATFMADLQTLNPYPGLAYGRDNNQTFTPDLILNPAEEGFVVALVDRHLPRLMLNPLYIDLVKSRSTGHHEAKQQLVKADLFIKSLTTRSQTLLRVAQELVSYQTDFFKLGYRHLKPLTLKQIANQLNLHEATLSRTVAGKYMKTPKGTISLKSLFSGFITAHNGKPVSTTVVKTEITLIIEAAQGKALSDQKIADILAKMGYPLARRTVAKYRQARETQKY